MEKRPDFQNITTFNEFSQYYWYREELSQICKSLGLEYRGTKQELIHIIHQYYQGNRINKIPRQIKHPLSEFVTIDTPLLECGFSFNTKFRNLFSTLTGITPFKFTADMATTWRKVKSEQDTHFTVRDMLKVYYGESEYAKYDHSVCEWNQFVKDFYADENSKVYSDKLKVASILWREVKNSTKEKIYTQELLQIYFDQIKEYHH